MPVQPSVPQPTEGGQAEDGCCQNFALDSHSGKSCCHTLAVLWCRRDRIMQMVAAIRMRAAVTLSPAPHHASGTTFRPYSKTSAIRQPDDASLDVTSQRMMRVLA
jgi:hypothetical protein